LRNRLFSLMRALAREDFETALSLIAPSEPSWTVPRLRTSLVEYNKEYTEIRLDPTARSPKLLRVTERNPNVWRFEQVLCDPEEHNDWAIFGTVDLAASRTAGHPVVVVERISS